MASIDSGSDSVWVEDSVEILANSTAILLTLDALTLGYLRAHVQIRIPGSLKAFDYLLKNTTLLESSVFAKVSGGFDCKVIESLVGNELRVSIQNQTNAIMTAEIKYIQFFNS